MKNNSKLISNISNFSIAYNFQSLTLALFIIEYYKLFEISTFEMNILKNIVFIGAILGQCIMGYVGDLLGRKNAILISNFVLTMSILSSSMLSLKNFFFMY